MVTQVAYNSVFLRELAFPAWYSQKIKQVKQIEYLKMTTDAWGKVLPIHIKHPVFLLAL